MATKTATQRNNKSAETAAARFKADIDKHERHRQPISWTCWAVKNLSERFISTLKIVESLIMVLYKQSS